MKTVNIYTDGACAGNQEKDNIGGWGCVLEYAGREKELSGGEINTTNNRMELTALIEALSALKERGLRLRIFSDSSYLVNCFRSKWYVSWQKNGWKNSKKQPVENRELWEKLLALLEGNSAEFYLVKGHQKLKEGGESTNSIAYRRFTDNNGAGFSYEDFERVVEYNIHCDALANVFINEHRGELPDADDGNEVPWD
ncbi:MAG: ribonuclease HI [Clostridia bacterium]|nr:ribonuclease HI [Clostridia bacterium]